MSYGSSGYARTAYAGSTGGFRNYFSTLIDTIAGASILTKLTSKIKIDIAGITEDGFEAVRGILKTLTDTVGTGGNILKTTTKAFISTLSTSSVFTKTYIYMRTLTDGISATSVFIKIYAVGKLLIETVGVYAENIDRRLNGLLMTWTKLSRTVATWTKQNKTEVSDWEKQDKTDF